MSLLSSSPDAVIFDFDGVIVQSVEIKAEAFATIYRNENPELVRAIIEYQHAHGGVSRREKFKHFEREFFGRDPTPEAIEALSRKFTSIVYDAVVGCPFVDGAPEALETLHAHIPLYLVSGTPHDELIPIVEARRLARFFKGIYGAPATKPQAFRNILDANGFDAGRTVAIGDSPTEYEAALHLGMPFVAIVPRGGASRFPSDVAALPDLVGLAGLLLSRDTSRR
jgi:phosphoglycolate phosphatase-like HAD superfamily hydrolase